MTITASLDRATTFSRPAARFDDDGSIEVRASAALNCRRSLWFAATGHSPTNPPTENSLMVMEAGNALEPVVMRAMERAGWLVNPADPRNPDVVTVRLGPGLLVTGHPDGTVQAALSRRAKQSPGMRRTRDVPLRRGGKSSCRHLHGEEKVVEVKTRGPEAFKRWRTLGTERSHPAAVAQAAVYSLGTGSAR